MKNYKVQRAPFVVPTDDGKLIEEKGSVTLLR